MRRKPNADERAEDDLSGPLRDSGTTLEKATLRSLDNLEHALRLQPLGSDRFRAGNEPSRFGRIFGGQLLAQAMYGAAATVEGQLPHSLHAYFTKTGDSDKPVDIVVERTRDGRSMSTRQVNVVQEDRNVLTAVVSFHTNPAQPELVRPRPSAPPPEELPLLQHWVQHVSPDMLPNARTWIDTPPPLEKRIAEPPTFLGGSRAGGTRAHWMRLPRAIGDDSMLHNALLAYASDYLLLDMAIRSHPERSDYPPTPASASTTRSGCTAPSGSTNGTCIPKRQPPFRGIVGWFEEPSSTPPDTSLPAPPRKSLSGLSPLQRRIADDRRPPSTLRTPLA